VKHAKDENVGSLDTINNDVLSHNERADACTEIFITGVSSVRKVARRAKRPVIESIKRVAISILALALAT